MMVCSHAGHDAQRVGNNVILANSCLLAGHSQVGDNAILSGNSSIHQFNRVGRMAFVSGNSAASMDVPPFCVMAMRNNLTGVNLVGMRHAGIPREHITAVREAYWAVFRQNMIHHLIAELERHGKDCPLVQELAEFCTASKRSIAYGRGNTANEDMAE